jgi:hypothetical protein
MERGKIKNDGWITVNCSFNVNIEDVFSEENITNEVIESWNDYFKVEDQYLSDITSLSIEDDFSELINECKHCIHQYISYDKLKNYSK